ncbi:MAG: flagellar hook-associated protein FlgK [Sedimentisphaerales bacterium]|nr:flagellar hook-associated protein FlgK [Sedimentisphaerales bacterium]
MSNLSIAISGLQAAQKGLDVVGNNLANVATEGYHRQRINFTPAYSTMRQSVVLGGGVKVETATRLVDNLLESEMLRQSGILSQVSQEYSVLQTLESALGEFGAEGTLSEALDEFFMAFSDLSGHTGETIWQQQLVTSAQTMASKFRSLGDYLSELDDQIMLEAEDLVEQANELINEIARLNDEIEKIETEGSQANNLRDERDQLVTRLGEIIGVSVYQRDYGVIDVEAGGIAIIIGTSPTEIEVATTDSGRMGLSIKGAMNYTTSVSGGKLGALMNLKNNMLDDINSEIDTLAITLINKVNEYHIQGLGSSGSFGRLDGWSMETEVLADLEPPITGGSFYIRITDTSTGAITRNEIDLSSIVPADPVVGLTLTDIANEIDSITGLTSWYNNAGLHIEQTADNYEFDFIPAVLPLPTASSLTSPTPPEITVSGVYEGSANDTLHFDISGAGDVGSGTLTLTVTDNAGQTVRILNIGQGYAAGDTLSLGNGISITVGVGSFAAGDNFDVDVFADTDTSGLLAAAGMNCLLAGSGADDIEVCSQVIADPTLVATSLGVGFTDNLNSVRLKALGEEALSNLNSMTVGDFYRTIVTDLGREIRNKQMQQENADVVMQNLQNQWNEISGVDINEEATQLILYEQMFQSMAKYMVTVQKSIETIMSIM